MFVLRRLPLRFFARRVAPSNTRKNPKASKTSIDAFTETLSNPNLQDENPELNAQILAMAKELGISDSEAKPQLLEGLRHLKESGIGRSMQKDVTSKMQQGMSEERIRSQMDDSNPYQELERKIQAQQPVEKPIDVKRPVSSLILEKQKLKQVAKSDIDKSTRLSGGYVDQPKPGDNKIPTKKVSKVEWKTANEMEKFEDPNSIFDEESNFTTFVQGLDRGHQKHWMHRLREDDRIYNKAVRKADAITEKRKIRDAYKAFKIDIHKEDDDQVQKRRDELLESTKKNVKKGLNVILQKDSTLYRNYLSEDQIIEVHAVDVNRSMSLVYAFFEVCSLTGRPVPSETAENVRRKLIHMKPYLRGQLVQEIGLKYAPEIRFVPYKYGMPFYQLSGNKLEEEELFQELYVNDMDAQMAAEVTPMLTPRMPDKKSLSRWRKKNKKLI